MPNATEKHREAISRKDFLTVAGAAIAGALACGAMPSTAFADAATPNDRELPAIDPTQFRIVSKEEIDRLWEESMAKARAEGAEIVLDEPHLAVRPAAARGGLTAIVQAGITVGLIPDTLNLWAQYETSSDGSRISKLVDKYIYGLQSSTEYAGYSHTIVDSGRTLVISGTATLRNRIGFAQTFSYHGEFGRTGGNFLSVAYV